MISSREEVMEKEKKTPKTMKKGKKLVKMIPHDYDAIVAYIEELENFREVMGGGKKTKKANIALPVGESVGLPEDTRLLVGDSQRDQREGDDSEDWMQDDDNLERECVYVNLVDADYGSDDDVILEKNEPSIDLMDDETLEGRAEEEEKNNTGDKGTQRRSDHQQEENMNMGTQRRSDHQQHGRDDEHNHTKGRRRNQDGNVQVERSRSGESNVTKSTVKDSKSGLLELYEEGLRNKLEFRKTFIDYRYASLAEKRVIEAKHRRCQLVIELRKECMSMTEIEEFVNDYHGYKITNDEGGMTILRE
ncbi:hypothetical protein R1sor_004473 [Riccia sorocarpa]|uniref:Uncharacterized protein n=1 Tax=Riccia sorocarpa TaxID=122646 RepID=A0ABD3HKA9_9MARC